jgi:hypothetical protein
MLSLAIYVPRLGDHMDNQQRWEPLPGLGVHEQISKLVEEFERTAELNLMPEDWVPIMDIPRLRPN